jgi:hypothetical protein
VAIFQTLSPNVATKSSATNWTEEKRGQARIRPSFCTVPAKCCNKLSTNPAENILLLCCLSTA